MESFCLPLLSYGCDVVNPSKRQLNQLNVCWNDVYRKVFRMHRWESVKEIQWFCDRLDFKHIIDKRKLKCLGVLLNLGMLFCRSVMHLYRFSRIYKRVS